jgi:hypothetical protein
MNIKFFGNECPCTKEAYLSNPIAGKYPRSDPRGRQPRPVPRIRPEDIDRLEWRVFQFLTESADTPNPYLGVILAWSEILPDDVAMAIWDEGISMLLPGIAPSDLARVDVLHNEPPARGHLFRRTALHSGLGNIHLPTGKKLYPFFVSRDEARVRAWRLATNRQHDWSDPEEKLRFRPWNGASKRISARLLDIMQYDAIPFLIRKLQDKDGRPFSVEERCQLLAGYHSIISARPIIRHDEECILLKYHEYEGGKVRSHLAHGTLFWHGNVRWANDRICAERKTPKRPPREMPKARMRHFSCLKSLAQQADEFSRRNILPEIRPILARMERRITLVSPGVIKPDRVQPKTPGQSLVLAPAKSSVVPGYNEAAEELIEAAEPMFHHAPQIDID